MAIVARGGKVAVSTDNITYTDVGEVTDASLSTGLTEIETTNYDSNGDEEHLVGISNYSLSTTANYEKTDAGQEIVRTSRANKTQIYYRYRPAGDSSGEDEWSAQGTITSLDIGGGVGDKVDMSFDVKFTGTVTYGSQP